MNTALATTGGTASANGINFGFLAACAVASSAAFNTTPNVNAVGVQGLGGAATVDGTIELQVVNTGISIAVQETFIDSATGQISVSSTLFGPGGPVGVPQIKGTGPGNANGFDNVAISLGDGKTVEAVGAQYGVSSWDAANRFDHAAMLPGLGPTVVPAQSRAGPRRTVGSVSPAP